MLLRSTSFVTWIACALLALFVRPATAQVPGSRLLDELWSNTGSSSALATQGDTVFVATGNWVGPATGSLAFLGRAHGRADRRWPRFDEHVYAVESDGSGGWFVGGSFLHVNGRPWTRLVHIRADMSIDTTWAPKTAGGDVRALCRVGNRLYLGGSFETVNGTARSLLAAVDTTTGALLPWNPAVSGTSTSAEVIALRDSGGALLVGGFFVGTLGGRACAHFTRLDLSTATAVGTRFDASASVGSFALDGATLFVGGGFVMFGGLPRTRLAAIDLASDTLLPFAPAFDNAISALAGAGGKLFAGGRFTNVAGAPRHGAAAFDLASLALAPWDPDVMRLSTSIPLLEPGVVQALAVDGARVFLGGDFVDVGGSAAYRLAVVDAVTGSALPFPTGLGRGGNEEVHTIVVGGDHVAVGGDFIAAGGVPRRSAAALDLHSGAALPWNPRLDSTVLDILPAGPFTYCAGAFRYVNGAEDEGGVLQPHVARTDTTTGAIDLGFDARISPGEFIRTLAVGGGRLFIGGRYRHLLSGPTGLRALGSLDASTGSNAGGWSYQVDHDVRQIELSPDASVLYVAGDFTLLYPEGDTTAPIARSYLVALDAATGAVLPWNVSLNSALTCFEILGDDIAIGGGFSLVNGVPRSRFAIVSRTTGNVSPFTVQLETGPPVGPASPQRMASRGSTLFLTGSFARAQGQPARGAVAFNVVTGQMYNWFPAPELGAGAISCTADRVVFTGGFERIGYTFHPYLAMFELLP